MDTMTVLGAILDAGLEDVAAFAVFDPAAVQQMIAAGVGARSRCSLGGKLDMPAIGLKGEPRSVSGRVRLVCDGRYRNRGPMARGEMNDMGPTAVFDTGKVQIVVISNHVEPHDLAAFTAVGIAPETQALRDAEEPRALARRAALAGARRGRMRRHRRVHVGLRSARVQQGQKADLSARCAVAPRRLVAVAA